MEAGASFRNLILGAYMGLRNSREALPGAKGPEADCEEAKVFLQILTPIVGFVGCRIGTPKEIR